MQWAYHYASMLESCLVCYFISAMFVSLPYFELFYLLVALTLCLRRIVERQARLIALRQTEAPDTASIVASRIPLGISAKSR